MGYKALSEFIDLDEAKKRLEKMNINSLEGKAKLAVENFLKDFHRKEKEGSFDCKFIQS